LNWRVGRRISTTAALSGYTPKETFDHRREAWACAAAE
jgi:hypothetical protein